jgi:hypothetical protein
MSARTRTSVTRRITRITSAGLGRPAGPATRSTAVAPRSPQEIAELVNRGRLSLDEGNALMMASDQPRLKANRLAWFTVPVALRLPANTGPGAAMRELDTAIDQALPAMSWTTVQEPASGYAIDAPDPAAPQQHTIHADLLLKVTVRAYPIYQMRATARRLLDRDLAQLRRRGVQAGTAYRTLPDDAWDQDDEPADDDFAPGQWWGYDLDELQPACGEGVDPDERATPRNTDASMYEEDELFDLDPFDPFTDTGIAPIATRPPLNRYLWDLTQHRHHG